MTCLMDIDECRRMMAEGLPDEVKTFDLHDLLFFLTKLDVEIPESNIAYRGTRTSSFSMMNAQMNFVDDSKRLQRIAKGGREYENPELIVARMRSSCIRVMVSAIEGMAYAERFLDDPGRDE